MPTRGVTELIERLQESFLGRCLRRFVRMAGLDRCIVLASQAFTALIPLLILMSTLAPAGDSSAAADTLVRKFDLTGESAAAVQELFATPTGATSGVSVSSALLLLFSGVSFTRRMQRMYRAAWEKEKAGIRGGLFAALGLLAMLAEVLVLYGVRALVRDLSLYWLWALPISLATGLILWTSIPYLLLNREVHWRRLLVAGGATALGTSLFALATTVYMAPLVTQYTAEFGLFGITIALIGWLLGASVVLVSCTAIGAEFDFSQGPFLRMVKTRLQLHDPAVELPLDEETFAGAGLTKSRRRDAGAGAGELDGDGRGRLGGDRPAARHDRPRRLRHLPGAVPALRPRERSGRPAAPPGGPAVVSVHGGRRRARGQRRPAAVDRGYSAPGWMSRDWAARFLGRSSSRSSRRSSSW